VCGKVNRSKFRNPCKLPTLAEAKAAQPLELRLRGVHLIRKGRVFTLRILLVICLVATGGNARLQEKHIGLGNVHERRLR